MSFKNLILFANIFRAYSSDSSVGSWQKNEIQTANLNLLLLSYSFPLKLFVLSVFGSTWLFVVSSILSLILSVIFFFFTRFLLSLQFNHLAYYQLTQFVQSIANFFFKLLLRRHPFFLINSIQLSITQ
jgi:uncharacterized membrane protein